MTKRLLIVLVTCASPAWATEYFVSSGATSGPPGCTSNAPCQPSRVFDYGPLGAGDIVTFKAGVYTGSDYMIDVNQDGSSSNKLRIRCETDGECMVDGQFLRIPLEAKGDHLIVEGFNICCSSSKVVDNGGNNNTIRRTIAWDADTATTVIATADSGNTANVLVEDCAGFGTGRKILSLGNASGDDDNLTARRVYGRWEGSNALAPKEVFNVLYNSTSNTCENCIGTVDNGSAQPTYRIYNADGDRTTTGSGLIPGCDTPNLWGVVAAGRCDDSTEADDYDPDCATGADTAIYGSIFYLKGPSNPNTFNSATPSNCYEPYSPSYGSKSNRPVMNMATSLENGRRVENTVAFVDPSNSRWDSIAPIEAGDMPGGSSLAVVDFSGIGEQDNEIGSGWSAVDVQHATSVSALSDSVYVGDGAHVCNRYVNRVEQVGTKLWPWPMQDRLMAVMTKTNYGGQSYSNAPGTSGHTHKWWDCPAISGQACSLITVNDPHAPIDVMGDILSLFGPIPTTCIEGGGNPGDPPPAPTVWRTDTEE